MILSIIIPIYNVENYLEDCLNSILLQNKINFNNLEIILINDGSTDESGHIAKIFEQKYPSLFKYFYKSNGGLSDARNYGIKKATGDFLMFVDSDDKLNKDILYKFFDIVNNQDVDLVVFNYSIYNEKTILNKQIKNKKTGYLNKKEYLLMPPCAWNKIIKSEIMKKNFLEFPIGKWYEDRGLTGSYVKYVEKIYYLDDIGYLYRSRDGSITNQNIYNTKMLDIFPIMDIVYDELKVTDYISELEYIFIDNLIVNFAISFLPYNQEKEIYKAIDIVNKKFPNWRKNQYLKQKNAKYRILCNLLYLKKIKLVKYVILRRLK